jgi:oligopeptide/dipeptide ABC transporter ATP-binding protein
MALLELDQVSRTFPVGHGQTVLAVDKLSLSVERSETVALIGESGSGKSTAGRLALRLLDPTEGSVRFDGRELGQLGRADMRRVRARLQVVVQEPFESLNPRLRVRSIVEEPLIIHGLEPDATKRRARVAETLEHVGLGADFGDRYPGELSGGQQQRVGVARAVVTDPSFVVLDEPTSSLDLSVRAQILQLLSRLQRELGMAYLFISHDIHTVRYVADRIVVMYLGRVVEVGTTEALSESPQHPYTKALLSSALSADPDEPTRPVMLDGDPTSPTERPSGCVLYPRCPIRIDACAAAPVPLRAVGPGHEAACIRTGPDAL